MSNLRRQICTYREVRSLANHHGDSLELGGYERGALTCSSPCLARRLRLGQAGQRAVVPLVQPPRFHDREVFPTDFLQHGRERLPGTLKHRRVRQVKLVAGVSQGLATPFRLFDA